MKDASESLSVSIHLGVHGAVAEVRGDIDKFTSPGLGRLLAAVVDDGHVHLVLDLAAVGFMDGAAVHVIADLAARLGPITGSLTLRSLSPMAHRLMGLTGLDRLVRVEAAPMALGAEQRTGDGSRGGANEGAAASARASLPLGLPATTDVVDAALRLVVTLARATVGGADGASVSLHRHGRLTTVAATDETISQMDRDQYATAQGPCVSAADEGRWFHVESLAAETRWPEFTPRAMAGGIRSILSTPLMLAARPLGALNIYSTADRAFGPEEQGLAALFATQASGILADAGTDAAAEEAWQRLQDGLRAREVIACAQGVLMEREGISAEAAHAVLRAGAQQADMPMRDRAAVVVESIVAGRNEQKGGRHG